MLTSWDGTPGLLPVGPWGFLLSPPGNEGPTPSRASVNGVGGLLLLIGVRSTDWGVNERWRLGVTPEERLH